MVHLNFTDGDGITHAATLRRSGQDEGTTDCGLRWLTFDPSRFWMASVRRVDCMACIAAGAAP